MRDCRLKGRQGGGPELDAIEIGVQPMHRLYQVPYDPIFYVFRHQ